MYPPQSYPLQTLTHIHITDYHLSPTPYSILIPGLELKLELELGIYQLITLSAVFQYLWSMEMGLTKCVFLGIYMYVCPVNPYSHIPPSPPLPSPPRSKAKAKAKAALAILYRHYYYRNCILVIIPSPEPSPFLQTRTPAPTPPRPYASTLS